MGTPVTFPNGQTLTSTALTQLALSKLMQTLTLGAIGLNQNAAVKPDYSQVRIDWPTQGQPFQNVNADVCYLGCTPIDDEYNRVRDRVVSSSTSTTATETWVYTRSWRVSWVFYGPSSTDRARMLKSAMFMDYFADTLSQSNLYAIPSQPEVTRTPELINAQWFERADFYIDLNEQVTETMVDNAVKSVETSIGDYTGTLSDTTVTST